MENRQAGEVKQLLLTKNYGRLITFKLSGQHSAELAIADHPLDKSALQGSPVLGATWKGQPGTEIANMGNAVRAGQAAQQFDDFFFGDRGLVSDEISIGDVRAGVAQRR